MLTGVLTGCHKPKEGFNIKETGYHLLGTRVHDTSAYTQGLEFNGDSLLESSGIAGKSWLARVDDNTGTHLKRVLLSDQDFGEGLTVLGNKIYLLTLSSNKIYVYDKYSYRPLAEIHLNYTGWGLCNDGHSLIMSSGDHILRYLDSSSFKITREVAVYNNGQALVGINELEYVNGHIFANVYTTNDIYIIEPLSGMIKYSLHLNALKTDAQSAAPNSDVLNGIALIPGTQHLLVTGKYWPKYYIITLADTLAKKKVFNN